MLRLDVDERLISNLTFLKHRTFDFQDTYLECKAGI